jgi:hypothetical protein
MSLPEHVYRKLESIVGQENISDRPHVLAAYRHTSPQGGRKSISPEAVLLPDSTAEVQEIVRVCNRYHIGYTAIVSLFGLGWLVSQPGTIIISLRRMNRILEINEEDGYAVIEPGVRHVQLKPEVMKRGLTYPVPSVGPSCSVMANFLGKGEHHIQHSYSKNNRFLLGYEWVTPTGEVVKVGSLANNAGWFCPDGPGPSLGGLIQRGNGIYTKAAIALDAWKGPSVLPTEGRSPTYKIRLPQDCHKVYIFKFPTLDKVRDFMIEMGKAEIGVGVLKFFYATAAVMFTVSANDFWDLWNSGLFQKELPKAVWVYLATWTREEMEYEERVMWDIVEEFEGEEVEESVRKKWENNMDFFVIVSFLQRVLKLGGGWAPIIHTDSLNHTFDIAGTIPEFINDLIKKGLVLNAPHNYQVIPIEYGHGAHIELLFFYDRTSPEGHAIPLEVMQKSMETDMKHGYYSPMPASGKLYGNYQVWEAKIREALGPDR